VRGVVGGLFLGVFLCVLGRSVFEGRIFGGYLVEERRVELVLEVVVVRVRVYMFGVPG
jgi:hypothetical protein